LSIRSNLFFVIVIKLLYLIKSSQAARDSPTICVSGGWGEQDAETEECQSREKASKTRRVPPVRCTSQIPRRGAVLGADEKNCSPMLEVIVIDYFR
jgi:hypothetical protein